MSAALKAIQLQLRAKAGKNNVAFFEKMIPGKQKIYGVKTPELNLLARQYKSFSFNLAEELWKAGALEEKIIAIKIIEKTGKNDPERTLKLFRQFSRDIGNWAICDGLGMQFLRGLVKTHRDEIFAIATRFSRSRDHWQRRLSLVMVEWYTRHSDQHNAINKLVSSLENDEEYYVQKAVSWIRRNFQKKK